MPAERGLSFSFGIFLGIGLGAAIFFSKCRVCLKQEGVKLTQKGQRRHTEPEQEETRVQDRSPDACTPLLDPPLVKAQDKPFLVSS